jgi:hypothetical protein
MLGRLRISIDEYDFEYKAILQKLYATKAKSWGFRQLVGEPMFDSKVYEVAVKEVIRNKLGRNSGLGNHPNPDDAILYSSEWLRETTDGMLFQDSKQRCKVSLQRQRTVVSLPAALTPSRIFYNLANFLQRVSGHID